MLCHLQHPHGFVSLEPSGLMAGALLQMDDTPAEESPMPATTSQPQASKASSSLAALAKASELNAQSSPPASPVVRKLSVFAGKAGFVFAEAPALAGPLPSCPATSSSQSCLDSFAAGTRRRA